MGLYTSPLKRGQQTAQVIAGECDCPWVLDGDLIEINHGRWEGKTGNEVKRAFPEIFELWQKKPSLVQMPAGESCRQVLKRARRFLKRLKNCQGAIVVVGHDLVLRLILTEALGLPMNNIWRFQLDNGGLTRLRFQSKPVLVWLNQVDHLKEFISDLGNQAL